MLKPGPISCSLLSEDPGVELSALSTTPCLPAYVDLIQADLYFWLHYLTIMVQLCVHLIFILGVG